VPVLGRGNGFEIGSSRPLNITPVEGDGLRRDILANLWDSLLRNKRHGDHHGFERGHRCFLAAWEVRREAR